MALAAIFTFLWGQLTYNPLSGYGIGFPHLTASGGGLGMGRLSVVGVGIGLPEQPAHSAHLTAMQADFSGSGRRQALQTNGQKAWFGSGHLQNLQMSFSRGKGWGFAVGLAPHALHGYQSSVEVREPLQLRYSEKAEGLLSAASLQVSGRWRALAGGYQLSYLWGTYERQRSLQAATQLLPDFLLTFLRLSGIQHRLGVLWQDSVGKSVYQISLTYSFRAPLFRELTYSFQKNFSFTSVLIDTFSEGRQRWYYPGQWRGGVAVAGLRWRFAAEGAFAPAGDAWQGPGVVAANSRPSWDLRLGTEWQPDPRSPTFYRRIRYQAGGYLAQTPYADVRMYGITAGLGWQFPRSPHLIYLAVDYSTIPHPQVRERTLQVSVAAVFRELWFIPPRID